MAEVLYDLFGEFVDLVVLVVVFDLAHHHCMDLKEV